MYMSGVSQVSHPTLALQQFLVLRHIYYRLALARPLCWINGSSSIEIFYATLTACILINWSVWCACMSHAMIAHHLAQHHHSCCAMSMRLSTSAIARP